MKEECQKASNLFLVKSKSTKGLHIFFKDFSLLILNSSSYTKETVHHELIHYFQKTLNIWLYDTKINDILENFNFEKIDHILSLKKYDIDSIKVTLAELMFNEREILTTIENIISDVDDLYNTFYNKKMTRFEFKDYVIDSLGTYQKNVFEHELCRNWEKLNLSKKDLHFFILSYILFDGKSVFQDINLALDLKWV